MINVSYDVSFYFFQRPFSRNKIFTKLIEVKEVFANAEQGGGVFFSSLNPIKYCLFLFSEAFN